ncbi:MAG: hypothetical protein JXQ91_16765 [Vannielia sp.]|uniref:hypothetical protein n=1 Tax=Vannielia sp. TaxID=2813045 RepID=UPI003B8D19B0
MVLEHVGRHVLTLALTCIAAPAMAQDYMAEATIGSFSVSLIEAGGACVLSVEGLPTLLTGLPAPCGFIHRAGEAVPQMFNYQPVATVAFIAGPMAADGCANSGQSLKLDGTTFTLGEARAMPGRFCHEGGLDEVMFRSEAGVD